MRKQLSAISTVTAFTRHTVKCAREIGKDRDWKGCKVALKGRIRLYPIEIEKRKLQTAEAIRLEKRETVAPALDHWVRGLKTQTYSTTRSYRSFVGKVTLWAQENGIESIQDVTADQIDKWRSAWCPDVVRRDDRIDLTTQSQTQLRLRAGCPLEKASKQLTHELIAVTQRHYAPWVKLCRSQLSTDHVESM